MKPTSVYKEYNEMIEWDINQENNEEENKENKLFKVNIFILFLRYNLE